MADHSPLPADEIRAIVRRVTQGVLEADLSTDAADPGTRMHLSDSTAVETGGRPGDGSASAGIAIGADHGGFALKQDLAGKLAVAGHRVVDCGTDSPHPVDYPDVAHAVARLVAEGAVGAGIIIDGAGIGSAMVANKVPGVRAALCYDLSTARNSREHNHANVMTLGAGLTGPALAWQIVEEWLSVSWGPDRHARRVAMIDDFEHRYSRLLEPSRGGA
ncbi:MAG: RpiB/LacA/LacB family sugar-phosphate isomerase [Acidimicrobiales bacterium]